MTLEMITLEIAQQLNLSEEIVDGLVKDHDPYYVDAMLCEGLCLDRPHPFIGAKYITENKWKRNIVNALRRYGISYDETKARIEMKKLNGLFRDHAKNTPTVCLHERWQNILPENSPIKNYLIYVLNRRRNGMHISKQNGQKISENEESTETTLEMITNLHLHSSYSDGEYCPETLLDSLVEHAKKAEEQGKVLRSFALTDHNTFNGIEPIMRALERKKYPLQFIPGIEISSQHGDLEVHLLGYFPNIMENIEAINGHLKPLCEGYILSLKDAIAEDYLERYILFICDRIELFSGVRPPVDIPQARQYFLEETERKISEEHPQKNKDELNWLKSAVSREPIRIFLKDSKIVPEYVSNCYSARGSNYEDLFYWYCKLQNRLPSEKRKNAGEIKKIARADVCCMIEWGFKEPIYRPIDEVAGEIASAGGIPVLAHPYKLVEAIGEDEFEKLLEEKLVPSGLKGLEVIHYNHPTEISAYLSDLCDLFGLIKTGGTDFHSKDLHKLIEPREKVFVPHEYAKSLLGPI